MLQKTAEENPMCGLCETPIDEDEDGGVEQDVPGLPVPSAML